MFQGYLLKINGEIFPTQYIQFGNYKATPNQIQDIDSYQDAKGLLHRNVLAHVRSKIEFNTKYLYLKDKMEVQRFFPNRAEVMVEYWNDDTNDYRTGKFYVPDITYEPYQVLTDTIRYMPIRIALIEY